MTIFKPVTQPERSNPEELQKDLTKPGWPYPTTAEPWETDTRLRRLESADVSTEDQITALQQRLSVLENPLQAFCTNMTWTFTDTVRFTSPWTVPASPNPANTAPFKNILPGQAITSGGTTYGPRVSIPGWYHVSVYLLINTPTVVATPLIFYAYLSGWWGRFYTTTQMAVSSTAQINTSTTGFCWLGPATPGNDYSVPFYRVTATVGDITQIRPWSVSYRLLLIKPQTFDEVNA